MSISKGVLEKITPAPYTKVDVYGKTADEVASEIIAHLGADYKGGNALCTKTDDDEFCICRNLPV